MTTVRLFSEECEVQRRVPLLDTPVARVEDVGAEVRDGWLGAEAYSPEFQVALPYQGLFVWEVGRDTVVGDPNQWEPAKWVARLRATMTGGGPVLLRTNMGAGHGGAAGRFDRLDEVAIAYAFALQVTGT